MRIFISYRRDDAAGEAGRLADHLYRRFGAERVFLDIDTIEPGRDFVHVLQTALEETAIVLVVIGRQWATIQTAAGTRRLEAADDYVRLEVESALARGIPVVPVLVQGAAMPAASALPASLGALARRQAFAVDHHEFHADAERLAAQLAGMLGERSRAPSPVMRTLRRWWPAAAVVVLLAAALAVWGVWRQGRTEGAQDEGTQTSETLDPGTAALRSEAAAQRRRQQYAEALGTLARARQRAPHSAAIRAEHEDVAMEWLRNARGEGDAATFGEAIKPALAVVDASLASAAGIRRADLLAHAGWAAFLLWRDGNRNLDPGDWYRDALTVDPANPYANAMHAHWILFRSDDVAQADALFETAHRGGRAPDAVRFLQWAAYANTDTPDADAARLRLADRMRRAGERLTEREARLAWSPFFLALSRERARDRLLDALPPEDYLQTLAWAFDDHFRDDASRQETLRYYRARLKAKAGREAEANAELTALLKELAERPGTLHDAVQAAMPKARPLR